jgi:hypothetical protein
MWTEASKVVILTLSLSKGKDPEELRLPRPSGSFPSEHSASRFLPMNAEPKN